MTDEFGSRLRELREKTGMTQEGLARAANVSTATVAKLERKGKGQDPAWSTVQALARALGVSVEAFQVDAATPEPEPTKKGKGRGKKQSLTAPKADQP